ncbi:MAG: hypothetical protein KIG74_01800 [Clostridiaceae bacterium]|nr:hypothetical protein [Clostridiaceae bacterium]
MYFGKLTVFLFGGGCAWTIPPPNAVKIHRYRFNSSLLESLLRIDGHIQKSGFFAITVTISAFLRFFHKIKKIMA